MSSKVNFGKKYSGTSFYQISRSALRGDREVFNWVTFCRNRVHSWKHNHQAHELLDYFDRYLSDARFRKKEDRKHGPPPPAPNPAPLVAIVEDDFVTPRGDSSEEEGGPAVIRRPALEDLFAGLEININFRRQ
jgi:hypothetical protein